MIRLNDLTIGYGHRILLQHASATIPAGVRQVQGFGVGRYRHQHSPHFGRDASVYHEKEIFVNLIFWTG